jgi:guanylate kinase
MTEFSGKLVVFTAPSGAGKTTIVRHLLQTLPHLAFSVSATSRVQRPGEVHGRDYYFLSVDDFQAKIEADEFVEWEEVYHSQYYGTLKSEVSRLWEAEKHIIFDIDVQGARSIKRQYGDRVMTVFVKPPSLEALRERLQQRKTETPANIAKRMAKANKEMAFENTFDRILVNDDLEKALTEATQLVSSFLDGLIVYP